MDPVTSKVLMSLTVYGPLGVLSILGFLLYFLERKKTEEERKRSEELAEKLYDISVENIKMDMDHAKAYSQLEKTLDIALKVAFKKDRGDGD